jgi:hypothetical protein
MMRRHIVALLVGIFLFSSAKIVYASQPDTTAQASVTAAAAEQTGTAGETSGPENNVTAPSGTSIEAAPVSGEEIKQTAGILPGTILYRLERSIENLELAITTSEESLAALKAQFAEERAAEAAILTENGETELADDAAEEYMETIASAADHLNNAIEQKDEATAAMNELMDAYAKSQSILQIVLDKAPESAKAVVQEALNNQDGAISAIQGFYAAKSAFFTAKQELEAAKKELEAARASGDEEAIEAAEAKVASAEAYKDEMEVLKDAAEKSKEEVKALVEKTEELIAGAKDNLEEVNEKMSEASGEKIDDEETDKDDGAKEELKKAEEKSREEFKKAQEKSREELKKAREKAREELKKAQEGKGDENNDDHDEEHDNEEED